MDDSTMAARTLLSISAPKLKSLWLDCSFDNFHFLFDAPQMKNRIKFRKLKYLTIQSDNLALSIGFAQAFPNVTHVHHRYSQFTHVSVLESALNGPWLSVDTLVFTMFKEQTGLKLNTALLNVLPRRRTAGHPMKALLLDRDHERFLRSTMPQILGQIQVDTVTTDNYGEYWWNRFEEQQRK